MDSSKWPKSGAGTLRNQIPETDVFAKFEPMTSFLLFDFWLQLVLRSRYAMSDTDVGHAANGADLSTRWHVLTAGVLLPGKVLRYHKWLADTARLVNCAPLHSYEEKVSWMCGVVPLQSVVFTMVLG